MFVLLSIIAVCLTFWLHYRCNRNVENEQSNKKALIKTLKDGLATFGLTFWSALLFVTFFESKETPISTNINGGTFKNSLDFFLKASALFLLFPFIFNLIKMFGELLLRKSLVTVVVNFIYNVMLEFGIFWTIVILGFYLFG